MQIGALDRRLLLQSGTTARDPVTNEEIETFATMAEVWTNRRETSAREFLSGNSQHNEALAVFTVRWRQWFRPGLRVICEGQTFKVVGVTEIGRREYSALQVRSVDSHDSA